MMTPVVSKRKKKPTVVALPESPPFEEAWSLPIKGGVYSDFCVDGPRVFFDQSGRRYSRRVAALEGRTGRRLWTYALPGRLLWAHDGVVLIQVGSWETHVVDAATGHPRLSIWSALTTSGRTDSSRARPVQGIGRYVVLFGEHDEHERAMLRCLDIHSGKRVWTYWPPAHIWGFALSNSRVVAQTPEEAQGLETSTGRVCWKHKWESAASPLIDGDRVFLRNGGRTVALDLPDGHVLWRASRSVDWAGEGLLYGLSNGRIEVTDPASGRSVRRFEVEIHLPSSLRQYSPSRVRLVAENHIFVSASTGSIDITEALLCLVRETGQCVWSHRPPGAHYLYDPVLTGDGRIYYRSSEQAYCLEPRG